MKNRLGHSVLINRRSRITLDNHLTSPMNNQYLITFIVHKDDGKNKRKKIPLERLLTNGEIKLKKIENFDLQNVRTTRFIHTNNAQRLLFVYYSTSSFIFSSFFAKDYYHQPSFSNLSLSNAYIYNVYIQEKNQNRLLPSSSHIGAHKG